MASTVFLKQKGQFFLNKKWVPIRAKQWFDTKKHEFSWRARTGIFRVVDRFTGGKGALVVRLLGLIPLARSVGPGIDQGEALRYLTEMIWFPMHFTDPGIRWEEKAAGINTAHTSMIGGIEIQADFHFGQEGLLEKITARRYREVDHVYALGDWEIRDFEFREFNGILVPYKANVCWRLETGLMSYYKLEITELVYNRP